ncbi:MAG: FAD dependent oxidoreductase family protein [Candidatus Tokpelaia hoelldobleri]|uniref:D-amino acid dehydrogenase n=1 Tax=Candidatus Tokpelaia hoelldobleri TaxID=1902579 RepID=A0A1U9JSP2_9HYPH|nr:MAG: FAD dependent oxidoreductase family protein [Candidatus Tokpelaia hoelldoblerii]
MKIIVLGSGVIGVTSAWYLARNGHDVTVIDRQNAPAQETSFANAGQLSFGYTTPWAAPGLLLKALKWMLHKDPPLIIRPRPSLPMIRWLAAMLRNCSTARYRHNKALMMRVSDYSARCLAALREETGLHYNEQMLGTLQLFRTRKQLDNARKDMDILKADGTAFELLDEAACIAREPGLTGLRGQIAGGLCTPRDETGDCHIFTRQLAALAREAGVRFIFDTRVQQLAQDGQNITGITTSAGVMQADAYLIAMAAFTPPLLKPLGLYAPIYPVKGYSITVPIVDETKAPVSTVIDESYKVAVTRLGKTIRVGGMAEISGYDIHLCPARQRTLEKALHLMFPGAADTSNARLWSGLRPVTPDSVPIIGKTPYRNLFINAGHGTLGWTMACGSGRLIADIISGKTPEIDTAGFDISRYH